MIVNMETFRKYMDADVGYDALQPDWGVNVLNVGHCLHRKGEVYPDQQHPENYIFNWKKGRVLLEYQIVYIVSGTGVYDSISLGTVDIKPGTLFFLYPGIWHRFKPNAQTGWEEYWVGFEGKYASSLMEQDCFSPERPLIHMGFNAEFLDIFSRLVDGIQSGSPGSNQLAACYIIQMLGLVYASSLLKGQITTRKVQLINSIRFSIHENLHSDIAVEQLAARHNVSYSWFRKAFKEVTGDSPGQYQLKLKLRKAALMLTQTNMSVAEIALKNGFESEYYFSKIFKSKMFLSPTKYRNS
jgi:AraC-like DNA-binding protein